MGEWGCAERSMLSALVSWSIVHRTCTGARGELPEFCPVLPDCCHLLFCFSSLLSSFKTRHPCSSTLQGRTCVRPWRKRERNLSSWPGAGWWFLWCFRSFKEAAEVPPRWLPSAEMGQMGLFLLWPIMLVFLCNKIPGQKWKWEVRQREGAGLTTSEWVGMGFAT